MSNLQKVKIMTEPKAVYIISIIIILYIIINNDLIINDLITV